MIRIILAGAVALALLHACAPPQPMGEEIWRALPHQERR
jgi:hypothetical protein